MTKQINRDGTEKYYAGIGSRRTPIHVQALMTLIAYYLEKEGYILRSGGAKGADTAFEIGVVNPNNKIIYTADQTVSKEATESVAKYHPSVHSLHPYAFKLMARNYCQIHGNTGETKSSSFVICWTPDACTTHSSRTINTGGTGQAISIASDSNIRIYNLADTTTYNNFIKWLQDKATEHGN